MNKIIFYLPFVGILLFSISHAKYSVDHINNTLYRDWEVVSIYEKSPPVIWSGTHYQHPFAITNTWIYFKTQKTDLTQITSIHHHSYYSDWENIIYTKKWDDTYKVIQQDPSSFQVIDNIPQTNGGFFIQSSENNTFIPSDSPVHRFRRHYYTPSQIFDSNWNKTTLDLTLSKAERIDYSHYYTDWSNIFTQTLEIVADENIQNFEIKWKRRANHQGDIYNFWRKIDNVDRETLEVLVNDYAKDKNHVYNNGKIIEWVNPLTFDKLEGYYYSDWTSIIYNGEILDADVTTFKLIGENLYADDVYLYERWRKILFFDLSNMTPIEKTDASWTVFKIWITDGIFNIMWGPNWNHHMFTDKIHQLIDTKFMESIMPKYSKKSISSTLTILLQEIQKEEIQDLSSILWWTLKKLSPMSRSKVIKRTFYSYILKNIDRYYDSLSN